ncbi:MAG: hypothetical protein QM499_01135 [Flavobacteriaceae bacterium]
MKTLNYTQKRRFLITLIVLAFCLLGSMGAKAQSAPTYKIVGNEIVKIETAKKTTKPVATTYIYKGKTVYRGSKGGLFVFMVSKKSGKTYKKYLKIN